MDLLRYLLLCALFTGPAAAASVTEIRPPGPNTGLFTLSPANFTGHGTGGGRSVKGNPRKVSVKDADDPNKFGRRNIVDPDAEWIDSNDLPGVDMRIAYPTTFRSFVIGIVDAHDQPARPGEGLGESFFRMSVAGERIEIPERERNGTVHYYRVMLDRPTKDVTVRFRTRRNDGFGIFKPMITRANQARASVALPRAEGRTADRRAARAERAQRERRAARAERAQAQRAERGGRGRGRR